MNKKPRSVLFVCNLNSVRSVMAEYLLKSYVNDLIRVESAGVRMGKVDNFAVQVMSEIDIDISVHQPKLLESLRNDDYDTVITLSPEAQHMAKELTRNNFWEIEYWPCYDVSGVHGSRDQILSFYREVRDQISKLLIKRFLN